MNARKIRDLLLQRRWSVVEAGIFASMTHSFVSSRWGDGLAQFVLLMFVSLILSVREEDQCFPQRSPTSRP